MGAKGAIIMSFFGAVFIALTMQGHANGALLGMPFVVCGGVVLAAARIRRMPGEGVVPTRRAWHAITWSTVGEVIGILVASGITASHHCPQLFLPTVAIIVGLHFLPIAYCAPFRPFYGLALALLIAGGSGFVLPAPIGTVTAGVVAAGSLWAAAIMALRRDWQSKTASSHPSS